MKKGDLPNHALIPFVIAAFLGWTTEGPLVLKSWGLLLMWLWLGLYLWFWIEPKKNSYRKIFFCLALQILAIIMLLVVKSSVTQVLSLQQEEVKNHLEANVNMPPGSDILATIFSVKNSSSLDIGKHNLTCRVNRLLGPNLNIHDLAFTLSADEKHMMLISGPLKAPATFYSSVPIRSGGDAIGVSCLAAFIPRPGPEDCADITLIFTYSLSVQPNRLVSKHFHFIAYRGGRFGAEMSWHSEPAESKLDYCQSWVRTKGGVHNSISGS